MTISFACPECGREYQVQDEFAGRNVSCKDCAAVIAVPSPAVEETSADADGDAEIFIQVKEEPLASRAERFERSIENRGGMLYKIIVVGGGILLILAFRLLRNMDVDGTFGRKPPSVPEAPPHSYPSDIAPEVLSDDSSESQ